MQIDTCVQFHKAPPGMRLAFLPKSIPESFRFWYARRCPLYDYHDTKDYWQPIIQEAVTYRVNISQNPCSIKYFLPYRLTRPIGQKPIPSFALALLIRYPIAPLSHSSRYTMSDVYLFASRRSTDLLVLCSSSHSSRRASHRFLPQNSSVA